MIDNILRQCFNLTFLKPFLYNNYLKKHYLYCEISNLKLGFIKTEKDNLG